ncbi:hypothetical protein Tco_1200340 [Tanacetum coccineum]
MLGEVLQRRRRALLALAHRADIISSESDYHRFCASAMVESEVENDKRVASAVVIDSYELECRGLRRCMPAVWGGPGVGGQG